MYGELNSVLKKTGVAGLALTLFCGVALAQEPLISRSQAYQRPLVHEDMPVSAEQQQYYHESGTAGRMGLGASPFHPEGPGNFSHR